MARVSTSIEWWRCIQSTMGVRIINLTRWSTSRILCCCSFSNTILQLNNSVFPLEKARTRSKYRHLQPPLSRDVHLFTASIKRYSIYHNQSRKHSVNVQSLMIIILTKETPTFIQSDMVHLITQKP